MAWHTISVVVGVSLLSSSWQRTHLLAGAVAPPRPAPRGGTTAPAARVADLSTGATLPYVTYEPCGGDFPAAASSSGAETTTSNRLKPHVVCVHGTFHDLSCFEERWLPELAARGYAATAVSLRGARGSLLHGAPFVGKVALGEHVRDVAAFLEEEVPSFAGGRRNTRTIVVAHSFGGPVAMELLRLRPELLQGVACLCSVPPTGNFAMTWRTVRKSPRLAALITRGFALKTAASSPSDARALFFDADDPPDDDVLRYVDAFAANSKASLDLRDFQRHLPARFKGADGKATYVGSVSDDDNDGVVRTQPHKHETTTTPTVPHRFVLGATRDAIVDRIAVQETATFLDVEPVFVDAPHDVMLGSRWRLALDELDAWMASACGDPSRQGLSEVS